MPDLIIKPKNQSGNKLILQDQAGGAVLTTADSGATAANLTLASTTTFPTGMVLQVVSATSSTAYSHNTTSWAVKSPPAPSLVTKMANSKIWIMAHSKVHAGSATNDIAFDFRRIITGGATTDNISGETYGLTRTASLDYNASIAYHYLDSPSVALGTTLTYSMLSRNAAGTTTHYVGDSDVASSLVIMEVAI